MAPFQRTRFALCKKEEATRNKEIIDISDDEDQGPTQDMTKTYYDICGKEIAKGEETCDMCFVMNSYARDQDLFNYNLNEISEDEIQETPNS